MAIKDLTQIQKHLFLCNGQSCKLLGAEESTIAIRDAIVEEGIFDAIHTSKTFCNGRCKDGPIIIAQPDGLWFKKMTKDKAISFVKNFLSGNTVNSNDVLFKYGADTISSDVDKEKTVLSTELLTISALINHLDH